MEAFVQYETVISSAIVEVENVFPYFFPLKGLLSNVFHSIASPIIR